MILIGNPFNLFMKANRKLNRDGFSGGFRAHPAVDLIEPKYHVNLFFALFSFSDIQRAISMKKDDAIQAIKLMLVLVDQCGAPTQIKNQCKRLLLESNGVPPEKVKTMSKVLIMAGLGHFKNK